MKLIMVNEIEKKFKTSGRLIGRELAKAASPGDIIDFTDFVSIDNSVIDEFVWRFFEKHSLSDINTIRFCGTNDLLKTLIQKAIDRRSSNVRINSSSNPKIHWKSVDFLSELSL